MSPSALLAAVGAVALLTLVLVEVFEVMLLPRRVRRRWRGARLYFRTSWSVWRRLAAVLPAGWRHEVLAVFGPLSMVVLLAVWAALLVGGFGVLQWAIAQGGPEPPSLPNQLYFSGVSFLTLGYGDVTAATRAGKVVSVVEAGVGFGFVAVVIGYLPVLYQLFSQREAHVIRLDGRAGSPPTGVALLERHAGAQGLAALGALLADWEHWAAELLESHLSYPMLAYYRSQQDNESWLAALAAVIDACALLVAGLERVPDAAANGAPARAADAAEVPRFQARMTFAAARSTIVEMAACWPTRPPTTRPRWPSGCRRPTARRSWRGSGRWGCASPATAARRAPCRPRSPWRGRPTSRSSRRSRSGWCSRCRPGCGRPTRRTTGSRARRRRARCTRRRSGGRCGEGRGGGVGGGRVVTPYGVGGAAWSDGAWSGTALTASVRRRCWWGVWRSGVKRMGAGRGG
jgi:hypothetical protein